MDEMRRRTSVESPLRGTFNVSFQEHYTEVTPLLHYQHSDSNNVLVDMGEEETHAGHEGRKEGDDLPNSPNSTNLQNLTDLPIEQTAPTNTLISTYGAVNERIKSYSLDNSESKYQAVPKKTSLVLCNHGKEFGKCCVDLSSQLENGLQLSMSQSNGTSDHCHVTKYTPVDRAARKRLITASILCLVFMIGEIVGGYLAGSLAIMTDAAHLLTDFASFMISLFSLWVAARRPTKRMSFGWYRAEVIGALTSVLLIWVVTGILVYLAVERIISKNYEIEADIMLITSGVGVGVNIIMGIVLYCQGGHGHSHLGGSSHSHGGSSSHGHDHGDGKNDNINVRAAFIHVIGDFFQSIGVFVAALIIFFKPEWGITDPICTFLFSIIVLFTTITILRDVLTVLMEGMPKGIDFNEVEQTFLSVNGVKKVHNLRIWSLSMDKVALAAHVAINPGANTKEVLKEASQLIRSKYDFLEMTLQIEDYMEEMQDCSQCQCPAD